MYLDEKKVSQKLPQKFPFKFVDSIFDYKPNDKEITALQTYKPEEFFFKGHFPNNPIVPGVLVIESFAQTGLLLLALLYQLDIEIGYLVQVDKFKFCRVVK